MDEREIWGLNMALITSPESILDITIAAMQSTEDQRLKTLVVSLTKHLHQFVLENRLTELEFEKALQFIVGIGQATGKNTNEVVLAADILGVSSLVSTINNLDLDGGSYAALLGPFWRKMSIKLGKYGISPITIRNNAT